MSRGRDEVCGGDALQPIGGVRRRRAHGFVLVSVLVFMVRGAGVGLAHLHRTVVDARAARAATRFAQLEAGADVVLAWCEALATTDPAAVPAWDDTRRDATVDAEDAPPGGDAARADDARDTGRDPSQARWRDASAWEHAVRFEDADLGHRVPGVDLARSRCLFEDVSSRLSASHWRLWRITVRAYGGPADGDAAPVLHLQSESRVARAAASGAAPVRFRHDAASVADALRAARTLAGPPVVRRWSPTLR